MIKAYGFNADVCPVCEGAHLDLVEDMETREGRMVCLCCGHEGERSMVQNEALTLWNGGEVRELSALRGRLDEIEAEIDDLKDEKTRIENRLEERGAVV